MNIKWGRQPCLRIIFVFFLCFGLIGSDGFTHGAEKKLPPKIEFDAIEKDLGTVAEGDDKDFEFIVMNTGGSNLNVSRLRSLCDCVEVSIDETNIQPGETAILQGVFKSAGRWGGQEKLIVLSTNAQNSPKTNLKIHLVVESGVRITPKTLSFGEIGRNRTSKRKVKIEARLEKELKIKKMQVLSAANVTARILKRKISEIEMVDGERGYLSDIDIILEAENDSAGEFSGILDIETNISRTPSLQILFSGEKIGDLEIEPAVIQFKNVAMGQSAKGLATIKSLHHGSFRIIGFDAGNLPLTICQKSDRASDQHEIVLEFAAPEKPRHFYRGYVYVLTDHAMQKRVKVGINAIVSMGPNKY